MPESDAEIHDWQVIVVGGGTAGVAAAISSARGGATTLLLERGEILGGNATQAFVHTFCGLFMPAKDRQYQYANPGFSERMAHWLRARGGAFPPEIHGKVAVLPTCPEKMPALLEEACASTPGLTLVYSTTLKDVQSLDGGGFTGTLLNFSGRETKFRTQFILDTSGDGHAAAAVGLPTEVSSPEELQTATFIFRVSGANAKDLEGYHRLKLTAAFNRGARAGTLPPECDSVLVRPTGTPGEAFISLNMPKPTDRTYNPLDEACLASIISTARERAEALVRFLREETPGWQACEVLEWPRRLGVRETRRIRGRYVMTQDDILEGRKFADRVALSTWPIELWSRHTGADFREPSDSCEIPLGALISAGNSHLGMAGRCMSASHEALGALRVMGTAMATGEAIGLAAALASKKNCGLDAVTAHEVREFRQSIHEQAGEQP